MQNTKLERLVDFKGRGSFKLGASTLTVQDHAWLTVTF